MTTSCTCPGCLSNLRWREVVKATAHSNARAWELLGNPDATREEKVAATREAQLANARALSALLDTASLEGGPHG